jgi:hypothetical protein
MFQHPTQITIPVVQNTSVIHQHLNYVHLTATSTSCYSSKLIYSSLSFFLTIICHLLLYFIIHVPILCHYSLFLHPTTISALIFLNFLSKILCPQIFLPSRLSVRGSSIMLCCTRDKSQVHAACFFF